jgi:uncharacterized protein YbjQ (UPF0145 family)
MKPSNDILVLTTSSVGNLNVKRYLKPVSAHVVAGTNIFSDFLASFTDVFGGRSQTYQRQLISVYNDAIEGIKHAASEIGANCILGLKIDMDEISGKGKSMFMLTAVGTAVIIERDSDKENLLEEQLTHIDIESVYTLKKKKAIIQQAKDNALHLNNDTWEFIINNGVHEVFSYAVTKLSHAMSDEMILSVENFYRMFIRYVNALPEDLKIDLLYESINTIESHPLVLKLCNVIKELNLFDAGRCIGLLQNSDFTTQKKGVRLATCDKLFYNKQDIEEMIVLCSYLENNFPQRGKLSTKKQLLSSKEKEIWVCECGKSNDAGDLCSGCGKDIYGFKVDDIKPQEAIDIIREKITLISELIA